MVKRKGKKNKHNNKKNKTKLNLSVSSEVLNDRKQEAEGNEEDDEIESKPAAVKRQHVDDSDAEETPRKKKKKKPVITETTDKKGKKSIRQTKRENYLKRQAQAAELSKNQLKSQCLSYLSQWKHDKQNWKFMKVKQLWLLKNKFSTNLVPDESWQTLIEYFESAKGNVRTLLLEDAKKVIKQMDEWTEKHGQSNKQEIDEENSEENTTEETNKPDEVTYKRARDLIQCLEE
ncbi:uncharacterized protein C7orf50 [Bombyx mandarina]|uniref:Uncharacterized protein C7orf50 n=1 Tax=Bombyx mandarina TaxID=7092 RepID=A0A6J2K7Q5_BOMMA|nr:uncharacterized protein C7orf50 [Bombyx mandarina]